MLGDISKAEHIYIACGYTDMRKSIDGLAAIVQQNFKLDPFSNSLFLFCGRSSTKMKVLYWEGDGFVLLYKRLENGKFIWPRNKDEVMKITDQQFRWLLEGLKIALDHIDAVIQAIRASKTVDVARAALIDGFNLSEKQAQAILDLRLQRLTGLEREKIENEYKELLASYNL